jgi:ParB family chromosome partitioning protein
VALQDGERPESGYRVIAGERRLRAAREAGLPHVPAILVALPEHGILLAQLIENLQRQDLPPLEEARGIERLMQEQKLSIREAAKMLGKDKGYLENRLRLLKMGEDVQEMVSFRKDTLPHARLIDAADDPDLRRDLINAVVKEGIGRREVERRILDATGGEHTASVPSREGSTRGERPKDAPTAAPVHRCEQQTDPPEQRPDPITSALRPANSLAAEAALLLRGLSLTPDYRTEVLRQLETLKKQIERIEQMVNEK